MLRFVFARVLATLPILIGVTLIVFLAFKFVPGDAATTLGGTQATEEDLVQIRRDLGLDQPVYVQYVKWLTNVLRGDFGRSQTRNEPVSGLIVSRLGNTLVLSGSALVLAITLGLVAGSVAAVRPRSWLDRLSTMGSLVGTSLPSFWVGIVLIVIFSQTLRIFPTSGMYSPRGAGPLDVLWHLVLPAFTLAAASAGVIARITRAALLDVLAQEYVTVARAKGLRRRQVVVVHALRNALIPIVTVIGLQAGFLLGGAVITETVFAWPGLGSQMIDAISRRDVPLALGSVLVVSAGFVLANLIADVSHGVIDPRLRS